MGRSLPLLALLLAGCGTCPPPVVEGGGSVVRARVTRAVAHFFDALGPDTEVCVNRVQIADESGARAGHYSRAQKVIGVDARAGLDPTLVVTHELCHALDHEYGIRWDRPSLWEPEQRRRDLDLRSEVLGEGFADACEIGPLAVQLAVGTCPEDTVGSAVFEELHKWFPHDLNDLSRAEVIGEERGSWTTHTPIVRLEATGTENRAARVDVHTLADTRTVVIDLMNGGSAPSAMPTAAGALPMLPHGWTASRHATQANRSLVLARLEAPNGASIERLLWVDDGRIQSVGCAHPGELPLVAGDHLWSLWPDGETVRWAHWSAVD